MGRALLENPSLLFLVVFIPIILTLNSLSRLSAVALRQIIVLCAGFCIASYIFLGIVNIFRPGAIWHDEPNILSVTAMYIHGHPIFHALADSDLYSQLYGPATTLVYAPFLEIFPRPLAALHVCVLVVNLAALLVLFFILRSYLSPVGALAFLPLAIAFLLCSPPHVFGIRMDPWMLLCVALSTFCAQWRNWAVAALTSGVFGGLAVDFKFTVVPVICLSLVILYRKHGLFAAVVSMSTGVVSVLAIFLLPRISLSNHLGWLLLATHQQHIVREAFLDVLNQTTLLILPCILIVLFALPPARRRSLGFILPVLCGFAFASCFVSGAKDGAGGWHVWPMLPAVLLWTAYESSIRGIDGQTGSNGPANGSLMAESDSTRTVRIATAITLAATLLTARYDYRDFKIVRPVGEAQQRADERAAEDAIDALVHNEAFSGRSLVMGYGANAVDYRTNLRFMLPQRGQGYFFDENSIVEITKERRPMPTGVVQRILGCRDVWLIPHGDAPFSTARTMLLPTTDSPFLFPDSIRLHFTDSHTLLQRGEIYDLWSCPSTKMP